MKQISGLEVQKPTKQENTKMRIRNVMVSMY